MPSHIAASPISTDKTAYMAAMKKRAEESIVKSSATNVLNVVKPPQKPTVSSNRIPSDGLNTALKSW